MIFPRLKSLFRRNRLESEMDTEIRFHLESRTEDLVRQGMTLRDAARQARLEFGPAAAHKDSMRASLGLRWLDELVADLVYAARILRKSPGFTAIAVASLALAIGANTVIFSFANQMLYVRLGVPHPEQLRLFSISTDDHSVIHDWWGEMYPENGRTHSTSISFPVYKQLRQQSTVTQEIFAFKELGGLNVTAEGGAQVMKAVLVSGDFFPQLQITPQLGRTLLPSDDGAPGTGTVAVISDGFWRNTFGASPAVLGKTIEVNTIPITIVGVAPRGFTGPAGVQSTSPELFMPLSMISVFHPATNHFTDVMGPDMWWLQLMARLKPGVSDAQATAALNVSLNAAVRANTTVKKEETLPLLELFDGSRGDTSNTREFVRPIYVLLGLAGLVLLLACANIANLMLARAAVRTREMSVRMALGAGRGRILRQVLTESLLVAFMGGAAGLFLGYLGRNLIPWLTSTSFEGGEILVNFDWRVFGFAAGITLITGTLFGIAPAWRSTHSEINAALKEGSRSATRNRKAWSGKAIVGFQVALSTLLVMSAAFFLRTLVNLNAVHPGFNTANLLLFDVNPPVARYPAPTDVALHHRMEDAFAAIPGVQGVTVANVPLLAGFMWNSGFHVEGSPDVPHKRGDNHDLSNLSDVGPTFFSVMQIPILAGRAFNAQDTETSVPVSVINQALAKKFFPGVNPIGKRFRTDHEDDKPDRWIEVIGICADTQYNEMRTEPPPIHFDLYRQSKEINGVTYIIRSTIPAGTLLPQLRRVAQQIDPDLPIAEPRTQLQQIAASMIQETMFASLTSGFGILALILACVGIYGIMAYTVSQRINEIGIRLALGAVRGQIRSMILRETGWLALTGVVIGLGATLALIRLVKAMLYGLSPFDPATLAGGTLLLLLMALIAGWVPANRASRVEPMEALRHD